MTGPLECVDYSGKSSGNDDGVSSSSGKKGKIETKHRINTQP